MQEFTHFDTSGNAIMVDVGTKEITRRRAVASGRIIMQGQTLDAIKNGRTKKGDVLGVARIAGIMAAKKTSELIPLCHTLIFDSVTIDFDVSDTNDTTGKNVSPENEPCFYIDAKCTVQMSGKTGAEMEALTGVSIALLTIYDMCKAVDRGMDITGIHLLEKSGGKSGVFLRNKE